MRLEKAESLNDARLPVPAPCAFPLAVLSLPNVLPARASPRGRVNGNSLFASFSYRLAAEEAPFVLVMISKATAFGRWSVDYRSFTHIILPIIIDAPLPS